MRAVGSLEPGLPAELAVCWGGKVTVEREGGATGGYVASGPVRRPLPAHCSRRRNPRHLEAPPVTSTSSPVPMVRKVPEKVACIRAVSPVKVKAEISRVPSVSQNVVVRMSSTLACRWK